MKQLFLQPIKKVDGEINLPGSKSVTNRALLLSALAKGKTKLTNILLSDDTKYMLAGLKDLGVKFSLDEENNQCIIQGNADFFNIDKKLTLFLGNAGTAMRPLTAALSCSQGDFVLDGEPRMKERPILHLVEALQSLGAKIDYLEQEGFPPIQIHGKTLSGGNVEINGSISSQFLTSLLMITPLLKQDTQINIVGDLVSKPYIDLTIQMMEQFGVKLINHQYKSFFIQGNQTYQAVDSFLVEGDASSASYFLAAGVIAGGEVKVTGVGTKSIQGDIKFANVLEQMGANIEWGEDYIIAKKSQLTGVEIDCNHIPDAAMTIAIAALFAKGHTVIRNVYNWRVKETDRLSAMATELKKVGASVEEGEDYIKISPPEHFQEATIDTYNDHRMAMCFSLIALSEQGVTIKDPDCTNKTFPNYFDKFLLLEKTLTQ